MKLFSIISTVALAIVAITTASVSVVKDRNLPGDDHELSTAVRSISQDHVPSGQDIVSTSAGVLQSIDTAPAVTTHIATATFSTTSSPTATNEISTANAIPTTNEVYAGNDTAVRSDAHVRKIAFWQFKGDSCVGDGKVAEIEGGNFGDDRVQGCFPIDDDSTRYNLELADGCDTTKVIGICDIPVNFHYWLPTKVCTTLEITGRKDEMLWYRCDGR